MVTGNFVNPKTNYYNAPCQVDALGTLIGHSHVVVEKVDSLTSTSVLDPKYAVNLSRIRPRTNIISYSVFAFFKGLNGVADNGVLSADVTGGLPAGAYRLFSINAVSDPANMFPSIPY